MPLSFNAGSCDLCGSDTSIPLLDSETDQSLRSDRCIISRNLRKSTCVKCGLVRSSLSLSAKELRQYYRDDYTLSCQPEHLFYAPVGQLSRSQAICDWILTETGLGLWRQAKRVLEIGAGSGSLLQQFIRRFPRTSFEGIELGRQAGAVARSRNLKVHTAFKDLKETDFDLVYAVGVIEHVPSPARFLEQMRGLLGKEGRLVLCQPTQDVSGYDLFFFDHLHHFGTEHLRQYARRSGFEEEVCAVGHEVMPNFSLHLWNKADLPESFEWMGRPAATTCQSTATRVRNDLARLDATLERLAEARKRVAVFGLNEVYWLAKAYSTLADFDIACGLEDRPDNPEFRRLGFPIVVPEKCIELGVQDVLLTMNRIYYDRARRRIIALGLTPYPVLS